MLRQPAIPTLQKYLSTDINLDNLPAQKTVRSLNMNFIFYKLSVANNPQFQNIKSLKLLIPHDNTASSPQSAALYVKLNDGTRRTINISPADMIAIQAEFESLNAILNLAYKRSTAAAIDWKKHTQSEVYSIHEDKPYEYYMKLHIDITHAIETILQSEQFQKVTIIDGACGNGMFLKKLSESLGARATYIGFDFNPENIAECKKNYTGNCSFVEGNLLKINEMVPTQSPNTNSPVIVTLSGAITRLVLKNGFEALQSVQSAAIGNVNYILGGGVGEPLINDSIAKRVGYKKIEIPGETKSDKTRFFVYEKMSPEEILQNKRNKILKSNILDLSLSPNPSELLKALKKDINNNTKIDLSFCQMTDELISSLHSLLKEKPNVQLVFNHYKLKSVKKFIEHFAGEAFIPMTRIFYDDSHLMGSTASVFAIRTGHTLFEKSTATTPPPELNSTKESRLLNYLNYYAPKNKDMISEALSMELFSHAIMKYILEKLNINSSPDKHHFKNFRDMVDERETGRAQSIIKSIQNELNTTFEKSFSNNNINLNNEDFLKMLDGYLNPFRYCVSTSYGDDYYATSQSNTLKLFTKLCETYPDKFDKKFMREVLEYSLTLEHPHKEECDKARVLADKELGSLRAETKLQH